MTEIEIFYGFQWRDQWTLNMIVHVRIIPDDSKTSQLMAVHPSREGERSSNGATNIYIVGRLSKWSGTSQNKEILTTKISLDSLPRRPFTFTEKL